MDSHIRMTKYMGRASLVRVNTLGDHLLAQLLHGNIYLASNAQELLTLATEISQIPRVEDWGFYDSVGVYFNKDIVTLDHVVEEYGEFSMPLTVFIEVLKKWVAFLENEAVNEEEFLIDLDLHNSQDTHFKKQ